jgi:hypothetical protein
VEGNVEGASGMNKIDFDCTCEYYSALMKCLVS